MEYAGVLLAAVFDVGIVYVPIVVPVKMNNAYC